MFYISPLKKVDLWVYLNLNARSLPAEVNTESDARARNQRSYVNINIPSSTL